MRLYGSGRWDESEHLENNLNEFMSFEVSQIEGLILRIVCFI